MKGLFKIIVLTSFFLTGSQVMAAATNENSSQSPKASAGMWICTTNASSPASGSSEDQSDKSLASNAASGDAAFSSALKNCRDCTKITCELQSKASQ